MFFHKATLPLYSGNKDYWICIRNYCIFQLDNIVFMSALRGRAKRESFSLQRTKGIMPSGLELLSSFQARSPLWSTVVVAELSDMLVGATMLIKPRSSSLRSLVIDFSCCFFNVRFCSATHLYPSWFITVFFRGRAATIHNNAHSEFPITCRNLRYGRS